MGRPSKLTEKQWADLLQALASGDKATDLAKRFKVSKTSISKRVSQQAEVSKQLAKSLVEVESQIKSLPVSQQRVIRNLADRMKDIQEDYASVAAKGAQTAVKIADLAGRIMDGEDVDPNKVKNAAVAAELHKAANVALVPATALVAVSKGKDQEQAKTLEDLLDEANRMGRPA